MLNDVHDYPEPHEFKPERFLKNGKLDNSVRDPMDIAFGFGRRLASFHLVHISSSTNVITVLDRICPGKHIAHSIVTLTAASVLSTFDLVRIVDENGQGIKPKREYTKSSALR
jgi:cytochrome P450